MFRERKDSISVPRVKDMVNTPSKLKKRFKKETIAKYNSKQYEIEKNEMQVKLNIK